MKAKKSRAERPGRGGGLLAQQAGEVLGLVQVSLASAASLTPGRLRVRSVPAWRTSSTLALERTDGLAQAGTDFRQLAAAEDERGNAEDDEHQVFRVRTRTDVLVRITAAGRWRDQASLFLSSSRDLGSSSFLVASLKLRIPLPMPLPISAVAGPEDDDDNDQNDNQFRHSESGTWVTPRKFCREIKRGQIIAPRRRDCQPPSRRPSAAAISGRPGEDGPLVQGAAAAGRASPPGR